MMSKCRYYPLCKDIDTYCCDGEYTCYQYEPMPDVNKLLKIAEDYEVATRMACDMAEILEDEAKADTYRIVAKVTGSAAPRIRKALGSEE